jgi:GT2 family glycosyltransferase
VDTKQTALDLSIIIVNYNARPFLLACIESIFASKDQTLQLECIVIDNVSTDGSVEAVQSKFPEVQVIVNKANTFFSAGNNQGLEQAQGRYILALNPDTVIKGNTLKQLVDYLDNNPEVGAITTSMFFPDGTLQRICARHVTLTYLIYQYSIIGKIFPVKTKQLNDWLWYSEWKRDTSRAVDVIPGSCIAASNDIWHAVQGFNARMRMYFSDDYFSYQVKCLGKQTRYVVSDGIIHYEGQSAKQLSRKMIKVYFEDMLVYTKLTMGRGIQMILACLIFPTMVIQYLKAQ